MFQKHKAFDDLGEAAVGVAHVRRPAPRQFARAVDREAAGGEVGCAGVEALDAEGDMVVGRRVARGESDRNVDPEDRLSGAKTTCCSERS